MRWFKVGWKSAKGRRRRKEESVEIERRLVGAKSRSTRRRSRAPGWKRRGRLRARMAARVHLTPIFPARGSVALSPSSSSPSASSAAAGPRSRLCHFFALVVSLSLSLFSILEDPKSLRLGHESAWSTAPPEAPTLSPFAPAPFNASALTLPTHPTLPLPRSSLPNYSPLVISSPTCPPILPFFLSLLFLSSPLRGA